MLYSRFAFRSVRNTSQHQANKGMMNALYHRLVYTSLNQIKHMVQKKIEKNISIRHFLTLGFIKIVSNFYKPGFREVITNSTIRCYLFSV